MKLHRWLLVVSVGLCVGGLCRTLVRADDDGTKSSVSPRKTADHERREHEDEDDKLEHLMKRVHKGRNSPLKQVDALLAADKPAWNDIAAKLPAFTTMSDALKAAKSKAIRDAADGYIDAAAALTASAGKKDRNGARDALKNLKASCSDCHYKGGPGGRMD